MSIVMSVRLLRSEKIETFEILETPGMRQKRCLDSVSLTTE